VQRLERQGKECNREEKEAQGEKRKVAGTSTSSRGVKKLEGEKRKRETKPGEDIAGWGGKASKLARKKGGL